MLSLESDRWSERDPHVVMRAIVEEDFIADIDPNADWSPESLRTSAGIERAEDIASPETFKRVCNLIKGDGRRRIDIKVCESSLRRNEKTHWSFVAVQLWPE